MILINYNNVVSIKPKVSVLSPCKNGEKYIIETCHTVSNQNFKIFEHIIKDGVSDDDTLKLLSNVKGVKIISAKDTGAYHATRVAFENSVGDYIFFLPISDGYLDPNWFTKCIKSLEENPDVSLVWGFPQYMSEEGKLGDISYPFFHNKQIPSKLSFFCFWLLYGLNLPEANLCVPRRIFDACFPKTGIDLDFNELDFEPWLTFFNNFHELGLLTMHINSIANYGRTHKDSNSIKENSLGLTTIRASNYHKRRKMLLRVILKSPEIFQFRDSNLIELNYKIRRIDIINVLIRWNVLPKLPKF
jgi:glycosyltransferase involved in cell wall biosynthesis